MYCLNCGAEIPEDSAFCASCGARVEAQSGPPQYDQPANSQPQYDQSYGQQPYVQQPYDQQPYGQPPYGQQPPPKKKLTWLWIVGGIILALGIAAILIFVVFKVGSDEPGGIGGEEELLSDDTVQAKFINDGVEVFSNAFSGLGSGELDRLADEPFDIDMEFSIDTGGFPMSMTLTSAYDKEKLGMLAEVMGQEVMLLLDEDTLYVSDPYGDVTGYRFDTDEDLTKPMSLKKRIQTLLKGMSTESGADYMLMVQAMVESINEDCFDTDGDKTTLTLSPDDIVDMLETLADKAEADDDLSDTLDDMDLDIDDAIDSVEDADDFELTITVEYDRGDAVNLEVDYESEYDYDAFNLQFGYEESGDSREITLDIETDYQGIEASLTITKDGVEIEYDGELTVSYDGTPYETYTLEGTTSWDGDEVEGSFTVADDYDNEYTLEYSGTVAFGMPEDMVEDDNRFDMDTDDADIEDVSDLFGSGLGYPAVAIQEPVYPSTEVSVAVVSEESTYAGGTGVIAVILPTGGTSYYDALVEALSNEASYYGWTIEVYTTNYDYMGEENQLEMVLWGGYDAVIIDPYNLYDSDIQDLEDMCNANGVPCVMLLDEGETPDGNAGAVWFDLEYAGADLAYLCPLGNVFVISNDTLNETYYVQEGLFYNSTYGIADYTDISVLDVQYAYDISSVSDVVANALVAYDIDTVICTNPGLTPLVFEELESYGFEGNMLCYAYETSMEETYPYATSTSMSYEYFSISDIAYYSIMAVADQVEYGSYPQVYSVTSYSG